MYRHAFKELDSTSLEAHRILKKNLSREAFVVTAEKQNQGRGQMGKTWSSPEGNLYATFVSVNDGVESQYWSRLPLYTSLLVADWLKLQFGLRIHLKWPNDLLLSAKKVAGVLCESVVGEKHDTFFVMGIGINLRVAPKIADYLTTCIADECFAAEASLEVEACLQSLMAFWQESFRLQDLMTVGGADVGRYGLSRGMVWQKRTDHTFYWGSVSTESGALELTATGTGNAKPICVTSANHDYLYAWQQTADAVVPFLAADFGNSSLKISLFKNIPAAATQWHVYFEYETPWQENLKNLRAQLTQLGIPEASAWPVFYVSVVGPVAESIQTAFANAGLPLVPVPRRAVRLITSVYADGELGMDRMALMEGFLATQQSTAVVLVSLGTATTIDAIDKQRKHWGGWILPGLQTALTSLNAHTAQLPALNVREFPIAKERAAFADLLGQNTRSAMFGGILRAQATLVTDLVKRFTEHRGRVGDELLVMLTGGYADLLRPLLEAEGLVTQYDPHLVAKGIKALVTGV